MFRLKELLKADERNTEALYDMAVLQERLGKPDEAQRWLEPSCRSRSQERPGSELRLGGPAPAARPRQPGTGCGQGSAGQAARRRQALSTYARAQMASGDPAGAKQSLLNASRRAGFDARAAGRGCRAAA